MANDKLSSDPLHLEPLDLNALDDYLADPDDKKEGAVRRFAAGFKKGFLQQTKVKNITRSFLRTALPDGYSRTIGALDDTGLVLKQIGADLESKHYNELDVITSKLQDHLPRVKKKTSDKIYNKLEDSLRERRERYAAQREYNVDPEVARQQRQNASDEASIREGLDGDSALAVELAVAQEEAASERFQVDMEARSLRDQIGKDRFDVMSRALSSIVVAQQKQVAFQDQITYKYQRKGLELQFRSFMALRDIRTLTQASMKLHKEAYTALVKNTGMPDHLKATKAEQKRWVEEQRRAQSTKMRYGSMPELLANFIPGIADNAGRIGGGAIQQLATMLSGGDGGMGELLMQQFKNDRAGFLGDAAGRVSSMALQQLLVPHLARRSRGGLTRFSNQRLQGRHNQFSYILDNAPALLQEFANNPAMANGTKGYLQKAIQALVPQFALNDRVGTGNFQTIGHQVAFNQLTQRSIVEIIPGYLARLLHETRMLRLGTEDVAMETYDITRGQFTTRAKAQDRLTKKIVGGKDTRNVSWALNEAINTYDTEGKLSPEARKALSERLLRDAATNRRFDPAAYGSSEGYAANTDEKVVRELSGFFKSKFKVDENGKMVASAENFARANAYSQQFLNIRNMAADPIKEINRLLETGNIGSLREIGVVITVEGQDKINYDRLWELYREGVTATNENPTGPDDYAPDLGPGPGNGGGGNLGDRARRKLDDLKAQMAAARKSLSGQASQAGSFIRDQYNQHGPAARSAFNRGRRELGSLYDQFAPGAQASVMGALRAGQGKLQALGSQLPELAQLKALPRPSLSAIIDRLPALPQVSKQGLLAKIEQAKQGALVRFNTAEQQMLSLIAQHAPATDGLQARLGNASLKFLPPSAGGTLALPAPLQRPDTALWQQRAQDVASRLRAQATGQGEQALAKVQDIYTQGKTEVLVTAQEILNRELIDVKTQKVIESIDDIKGAVVDKVGQVRITAGQYRAGLTDVVGKGLKQVREAMAEATPLMQGKLNQLKARLNGSMTTEEGLLSRVKDLYVERVKEPVLLARDMVQGRYVDVNTQKVIETVDDITGPVADAETQEILVTAAEVAEGFTDNEGAKVRSSKLLRSIKNFAWVATRPAMLLFRTGRWAAGKVFRTARNLLVTRDAYLPERMDDPILTARKLRRGEYFSGQGEPLTSFDDLRHGVFDANGQAVVSVEDIPRLVNRDGTKHTAAKRRWAITNLAKAAFKGAASGYWNRSKKYYMWLGKKMDDPFNKKVNPLTGETEDTVDPSKLKTPTDSLLGKILSTLSDRLPGKGPRKGSWEANLAAEEKEDAENAAADKAKREQRLHPTSSPVADAMKLLAAQRGEEDDEEDGDTNISIGEGGDSAQGRQGRRRKPKGRFGKWLQRAGRTRAGRVAGTLGRGALSIGRVGLMAGADALLGAGSGAALAGGLSTAGTALMGGLGTAASLAGSAVTGAGALLAGLVTSPVLLGAAAVAAVAGGGYWLYSRHSKTSGDFRELRLLQYGSNSTSLSLKMLEVESLMESVTTKSATPDWTFSKEIAEKVMNAMGIDKDEPAKIAQLAKWIDLRMKPVFMAYIKALATLAQGPMALNDIDDKFPEAQKGALLDAVKMPSGGSGPYGFTLSPDGDEDPLEVTPDDIQKKFAELKDKFVSSAATGANNPVKNAVAATVAPLAVTGTVAAAANGANPVAAAQANLAKTPTATAGMPGTLKAGLLIPLAKLPGGSISALQSIRMRAYGLDTVDTKNVTALLSAESYVYGGLRYSQQGQAEWSGDAETLVQDLGPLFGINASDPTDKDRVTFVKWVYYRFAPAFLAFATAVKAANSSVNTLDGVEKLSAHAKVQIANAVMTATADFDGDKQSIWMQPHIFTGNATAEVLKSMAKRDLEVLNQEAEKETVSTPTQSAQQQAAAMAGGASAAGTMAGGTSLGTRMMNAVSSFGQSIATKAGEAWQGVKNFFGGSDSPGTGVNAGKPYDKNTPTIGGALTAQGNVYQNFASGTGGQFEKIPLPSSNKSREGAMPTLKAIQEMTGVDAELLATFCSIESGFDYLVKAGTSSATGWFQFIDDTWDAMIRKYGSKYGIPPNDPQRALRKDPRVNGLMGAEFLKENYAILAKALGRAPTDVDLYCAHFFGPYGATKFLQLDPNALAALAFPKQASANASIFYKAPGQPRTMREIYQLFEEKVSKHRKGGGRNILLQKAANDASPVDAANAQAAAVASGATNSDTPNPSTEASAATAGAGTTGVMASQPNVSQQVRKTAFPLTMPTVGGTGVATSSGATPAKAGDDIPTPQVGDDAATTAAKAAAKADKLKQAQVQDHMDNVKAATDLQAQQLAVQSEMRDYLKVIAQGIQSNAQGVGGQAANGMEKTSSGTPARSPGNRQAPISMSN